MEPSTFWVIGASVQLISVGTWSNQTMIYYKGREKNEIVYLKFFAQPEDLAKPPASKNECEHGPFFNKNHSIPILILLNNFVKEYNVSEVLHSCCM